MRNRHHRRLGVTATAMVVTVGLVGVARDGNTEASTVGGSPGSEACDAVDTFDSQTFSNAAKIDNRWFPLIPGTQLILDGEANRGSGLLDHRVIFTVTDVTKVINGVRTLVVWDRDYNAGELQETELAFWAQDDEGNVWNFGEYPEEFEDGEFDGAPSTWIAGLDGAVAGIHMPAQPAVGARYLQGWAESVDFLDCQTVIEMDEGVCVPFNCYEDVVVTSEWSPLEEDSGKQLKYYAPGVGIVQVGAIEDPEAEVLQLVSVVRLSPAEMAEVRRQVMKLDKRAYENTEVYRETPPAE